jgi:2-oxoisovalerate dehydrogenase E1 component beta subunit
VTTFVTALNAALSDSMKADPRVLLMGEDVGDLGGVFRVTDGLIAQFGEDRVLNTPISESTLVGAAVGLAMGGYRPVVEMQFDSFVYPAFAQITWHLSRFRYRSRGQQTMPVVIRVPYGGNIGAAEHHSDSPEAYFIPTPGLKVFTPSTPSQGYALLREAIEDDDPVIFFEPKHDYWVKEECELAQREPDAPGARIAGQGSDLTLVGYGPTVKLCLAVREYFAQEGVSIEVLDLFKLNPLEINMLVGSVTRTGRMVVVHEAPVFGGFGGELVARVAGDCFAALKAPPLRVGAMSTPYPAAALEHEYLPGMDRIVDAVDTSLRYGVTT